MQSVGRFIHDIETIKTYRTSQKAFTRDRKLTFANLVLFLMNMPKRILALELHDFFTWVKNKFKLKFVNITPSALTQRREKLAPELFVGVNDVILKGYYADPNIKRWNGFRLLGIDGSKITLPFSKELQDIYGVIKNQSEIKDIVQARVSVLYDVLNEMVIDGMLSANKVGEITLAHKHILRIQSNDLLLLDRGYPSFALAYDILQLEGSFLFRCKASFNKVVKHFSVSDDIDKVVCISPKQKQSFKGKGFNAKSEIHVRLLKITLKNGEEEILMASLLDQRDKTTKHHYKVNVSLSLGFLKYRIINILSDKNPRKALEKLKELLLIIPQPERKGRSFNRKVGKYVRRTKPPMFKNRKQNI